MGERRRDRGTEGGMEGGMERGRDGEREGGWLGLVHHFDHRDCLLGDTEVTHPLG